MKPRKPIRKAICCTALLLALGTLGWNPLFPPTTFRWSTSGPVVWNPDGGPLGMLSNGDAVAITANAFDVWEAVPTSVIDFVQGPQIVNTAGTPVDVTSANYAEIVQLNNGQNPIIFDNDRELFDFLGAPAGLAGFATPQFADGTTIVKSFMILEGDFVDGEPVGTPPSDPGEISLATLFAVQVHEIGHFVGLGHTTLNRNIAGINGCPAPGIERTVTMHPTVPEAAADLHFDDRVGLSELYPTAAFLAEPRISGHLLDRMGDSFDGGNVIARAATADCDAIYDDAQAMQSGSFREMGGRGGFTYGGLAAAAEYTIQATSIVDFGAFPIGGTSPPPLGAPNEFYNGANEDYFQPPDDPNEATAVVAGTTGLEIRLNNSASAGTLPGTGPDSLRVDKFDGQTALAPHAIVLDDGTQTSAWGFTGTALQAWINRFTPQPEELPYRVERIDLMFWHPSAAPGRGIQLLVYIDTSGSGDPANATLAYTENTVIQGTLSDVDFQQFTLATPVVVPSGDVYVGVFDQVADAATNFIAVYDEDEANGRAYLQVNANAPADFAVCQPANPSCSTDRTWMVRIFGSQLPEPGRVGLTWGDPCNQSTAPGQDFGVYRADLGVVSHAPVSCTTRGRNNYVTADEAGNLSWLVTPEFVTREGSLAPHTLSATCKIVGPDDCP